jgi:hypothetical protein
MAMCPYSEFADEFVNNTMSPSERSEFAAHARKCAECAAAVDGFRIFKANLMATAVDACIESLEDRIVPSAAVAIDLGGGTSEPPPPPPANVESGGIFMF